MIFVIEAPHVVTYSFWVEADSREEAMEKFKNGDYIDSEETGDGIGITLWKKGVIVHESDEPYVHRY